MRVVRISQEELLKSRLIETLKRIIPANDNWFYVNLSFAALRNRKNPEEIIFDELKLLSSNHAAELDPTHWSYVGKTSDKPEDTKKGRYVK